MPPPQPHMRRRRSQDFGGWYLRGDIGFSNQSVKTFATPTRAAYDNVAVCSDRQASTAPASYGVGVGYQFNNWFRADVTGEYRGNVQFHAASMSSPAPVRRRLRGTDTYTATKSELGRSRQRLCRSRHLVVHNAVHRRRRRYARGSRSRTSPITGDLHQRRRSRSTASTYAGTVLASGISPGRCMRVSPTRSAPDLRSNSPTAMSTWATA